MSRVTLKPKDIEIDGNIALIAIGDDLVTVDSDSVQKILDYRWSYRKRSGTRNEVFVPDGKHVCNTGSGAWVLMSRLVTGLGPKDSRVAYVIDGNGLNMRLSNILVTSRSNINRHINNNGSGVGGVTWIPRHKWWQVYAVLCGNHRYVGCFTDINEAIAAKEKKLADMARELKVHVGGVVRQRNNFGGNIDGRGRNEQCNTPNPS
jgi:hypothetical protein